MNKSIEEKLKNWEDWSFEGTAHHQFLSFKILPLDEKLKAAEEMAQLVEEFLERGNQRRMQSK